MGSVQTLLFGGQQVEVTVVGRVTSSAAVLLVGGAGLVADNEAIAQWQPTDTPSGEIRSAAAFPGSVNAAAHVQTFSDDYFASRNKYFLLFTAFTVVVAIVAVLTIYSAMNMITGSRVRETRLVRAIGGSSIGILAAAVVEATVLGILGVALGLPLGVAPDDAAPAVTEEHGIRVPLDNVGLPAVWLATIGPARLPSRCCRRCPRRCCRCAAVPSKVPRPRGPRAAGGVRGGGDRAPPPRSRCAAGE